VVEEVVANANLLHRRDRFPSYQVWYGLTHRVSAQETRFDRHPNCQRTHENDGPGGLRSRAGCDRSSTLATVIVFFSERQQQRETRGATEVIAFSRICVSRSIPFSGSFGKSFVSSFECPPKPTSRPANASVAHRSAATTTPTRRASEIAKPPSIPHPRVGLVSGTPCSRSA
jgi:hypothetical protein